MLNDADYLRLAAGQTYRDALAQVTGHADPHAANETSDVFGRIVRRFTTPPSRICKRPAHSLRMQLMRSSLSSSKPPASG
jgi:hypothetical protein